MLKARTTLLCIGAFYLASTMLLTAQTLERRLTVVEQQLSFHIDYVSEPAIQRLQALEARVTARDIQIEGRLVALERSISNFGQLLLAVGAGVLIQLITSAIGGIRAARSRQGS